MKRTKEQPRQHSVFCKGSTIKGAICLPNNSEEAGDNTVSFSQATTLKLWNDKLLEPCNINWTPEVQNQQKVSEKCKNRVSFREIYTLIEFFIMFYPPLGRA